MPSCEAIKDHRETLSKLLRSVQDQIPAIEKSIETVQSVSALLQGNYKITESEVTATFDSLENLVLQHKVLVLNQLQEVFSKKQHVLQCQLDELTGLQESINSCCQFTENALHHGNETEVLLIRKEMTEKLAHLAALPVQPSPEENEYIGFVAPDIKQMQKVIGTLGSIQTNSAVSFETTAMGEGLKRCYVGRETRLTVTTKDKNGDLVKEGNAAVTAELTSSSGLSIQPIVVDNQNGTYDLKYTVPQAGAYQLQIKLFEQPIKSSPFLIRAFNESGSLDRHLNSKIPQTNTAKQRGVKRPSSSKSYSTIHRKSNAIEDDMIMKIGAKGKNKTEFTNPQGVCVNNDKILVADSNNQCVTVFNIFGDYKLRFGNRGRAPGQMQRPTGVAVTLNGNYLVADYDNRWISIYSPEGKYLNKIGAGKLLGPKGICVDHSGHIIVVDNKASCIFVFLPNGKLLHTFGGRGNAPYQFAGPHFCAINSQNDIIVTDFHNHSVKVFDCEGQFRFCFGSSGEGNGQFSAPTGVAVDKLDNILVADWGNSRIQVRLIIIKNDYFSRFSGQI